MAADLTGAVLLSRTRERRDFVVPSQPEVKVGYDRSNDVAVPYEGVSRSHAKITFDGKEYWIEDLGSANGTYLNAALLTHRERLKHLDVVTLGRRADLIFVRRSLDVPRKTKMGITAVRLEILDGLDAGTNRDIPRGNVTIGRTAGNNIVADSQLVSKVHARIERSGVELVLTDLQSANGTFVNGEKIDSRVLKDGDEISVGRARSYRVRIELGEVLTGDVAVVPDKASVVSLSSLPMDWRTHMEWSPEEAAEFDKARAKLRQAATGKAAAAVPAPAAAPTPSKAPAPAKAPEKPKAAKEEAAAAPKAEEAKPAAPPKPVKAEVEAPKAAPPPPAKAADKPAAEIKAEPPKPPAQTAAPEKEKPAPEKPAIPPAPEVAPPPAVAPPPVAAPAPVAPPAPPTAAAKSPLAAAPPAREATATRALTQAQMPRVFLESPARTFPLGLGTFAIGRDPSSDVRLDGSEISRHHAKLQVTEQAAVLEDLKTVNGTYINRQKLAVPTALADGDEVTFGSLRFKLRFGAGFPKA